MKINRNKGISLIVLVVTIIVVIILVGAVILSLSSNNPISQASKATYLSDVRNFQAELGLYETNEFADKLGAYDPTKLQADEASVTYDGNVDTSKTMNDLIPTLGRAKKYSGQFIVVDGKLVFQGSDTKKQDWSREAEIEVLIVGEPKVTIIPPSETVVASGTDIIYTVKFSSNAALTSIDLSSKVEVVDNSGVALPIQPVITIGTISGSNTDAIRQVDITIKTDSLIMGGYKLKIKSGSVTNENSISNSQDTVSLIGFDIADNVPPENPTMSANPTAWTNGDVTVTITYSEDSAVKEYSLDSVTWNIYTSPVSVTDNNTTVYSRGKDAAGNESGVATITVANIDKIMPTVTASNGGATSSSVTVTAVASDTGGSGLNTASYQYSKDNGTTWTATTSATSYTFSTLTTGIYDCKVKVVDNALNSTISSAISISTTAIGTVTLSATPTAWTNGNVTVTITYPAAVITKQYSLNGTTWNTYTTPVVVSTNNTTVYAKGLDAGGNQTSQATLTVSNIDKTVPTVTAANGGSTSSSVTVNATASDTGGSGLNAASYQYSKDNGTTWTTATSATNYTFNTLTTGTYQCKVKVADNAVNTTISSAVAITTQSIGTATLVASPTAWTNGNVTVTITYPAAVVTKQYSTNGTTWYTYTTPVVITANNITVYAKGSDAGGNQTTQATLTVSNIDKTVPTVTASNGGSTSSSVTVNATASDTGGSGLNAASYQYSKDNGTTWTTATSATSYVFSSLTPGTYQCKVKVADNATNSTISNAVAIIITPPYDVPVIPAGFTYVEGTWSTGYVIKDTSYGGNNEFVWVPAYAPFIQSNGSQHIVGVTSEDYSKKYGKRTFNYLANNGGTLDSYHQQIIDSVEKYGGFYIARYEASNNNSKAQSKKNQVPWVVNGTNAKSYSESMDTDWGWNTSVVESMLINGSQWDTTLEWLIDSGDKTYAQVTSDSTSWGNYINSTFSYGTPSVVKPSGTDILLNTGVSEQNKSKNIYDLAGNAVEYTSQGSNSRGGIYYFNGYGGTTNGGTETGPASSSYNGSPVNSGFFRTALYIH